MKTSTYSLLYQFIKEKPGVTAREVIDSVRHHPTGIFKHLKALQKSGLVYKIGRTPKVRYYAYMDTMTSKSQAISSAINWAVSGAAKFATPDTLCPTRDVFQARNERLVNDLKKMTINDNLTYLLAAAVGEIGNNSFDHNLGHWQDMPGAFFQLDTVGRTLILADRGQGVQATIRRVRPDVTTDARALEVAFTEMISGRAPEKRGNGLKFVKKIMAENHLRLAYYTGEATAEIDHNGMTIKKSDIIIPGTLAQITF